MTDAECQRADGPTTSWTLRSLEERATSEEARLSSAMGRDGLGAGTTCPSKARRGWHLS